MGNPDALAEIDKIKEKENTILLLDAFDEDLEAVDDYKKRFNHILSKVHKFREIVITCRTQFFPSEKEEPDRTGYFTGGEKGEYRFQKIYLSVFDDKAVTKYLRKRFSLVFQYGKYRRAKEIAKKSPNLVVRPMLLSYIEDLVKSEKNYNFSFQIYEEMIDKWLDRESKKPRIAAKFKNEEQLKEALKTFSQKLAVYLYENREKHGGYFLPKGKTFDEGILTIADIEGENMSISAHIGKTKSLLNRDAAGNYKFSHKSILEYFLAKELTHLDGFYTAFNFTGMDQAQRFYGEMCQIPIMIKVEGGTFEMGSNYTVILSTFEIGKYPITQAQWETVMGKNPSNFREEPHAPVEKVSWKDVQIFIQKLNKLTGQVYRLPTEAEWEFAARGGAESKGYEYAGSNNLGEVGWYNKNSKSQTHPVGKKLPNELGLYDMSGNVWEWCQDWYGDYPSEAQTDPQGPESGDGRVIRGGSWDGVASDCRVASRNGDLPSDRGRRVGFRLANTVSASRQPLRMLPPCPYPSRSMSSVPRHQIYSPPLCE